ncbi:hypothetical protein ACOTVE_09170 [Campylobacter jejuni]|uniref:hypothetical protein n=1 Tax=Campylobacter jejuni TaxID=197 RepID=UPI003B9E5DB0
MKISFIAIISIIFLSSSMILSACTASSNHEQKTPQTGKNTAKANDENIKESDIFKDGSEKDANRVFGKDAKKAKQNDADKEEKKKVAKTKTASATTTQKAESKPAANSTSTTKKSESKPATSSTQVANKPAAKPTPKPQPAPQPAPTPAVALIPEGQAKAMLDASGIFKNNGTIYFHPSTTPGIAPAPSVDARFQGGGHVSSIMLYGDTYASLIPDEAQFHDDLELTRRALKQATDAVFGPGTANSQELYSSMIKEAYGGPNLRHRTFSKIIGGHKIDYSAWGEVYVIIH